VAAFHEMLAPHGSYGEYAVSTSWKYYRSRRLPTTLNTSRSHGTIQRSSRALQDPFTLALY
jgi:hypothetical protein